MAASLAFYEFFAGGGMARAGLGDAWACRFANDLDPVKLAAYRDNWGEDHLHAGDVNALTPADLPGRADLAWASSPCQDLSLAGLRGGLDGARSGAFWGFWRLMQGLAAEGRAPQTLVVENVAGLLTSGGGGDFTALCVALAEGGYRVGALEIDAARFLPQSRPRLFVIATRSASAPALAATAPGDPFHTPRLIAAQARLPDAAKAAWAWWGLPQPPPPNHDLAALLEPDDVAAWSDRAATQRLLSLLSPRQRARLAAEATSGERRVGALFRRTRVEAGLRVQRAEIRFDGLAGCLRTPRGGSSRQTVVVVEGARVRTRPLTPREGARLMGLGDDYRLPKGSTAALQVVGDGVAAPVVRWLARHLLEPLARGAQGQGQGRGRGRGRGQRAA